MVILHVRMAGSHTPRHSSGVCLAVSCIESFFAFRPSVLLVIKLSNSCIAFSRCDWPWPIVFSRSDLWQLTVVLPGWPGGCHHHISPESSLEGCELCFLARGLWSDEPRSTRHWGQLFLLVGDQHDLQWLDTPSQTCVVVQIQYVNSPSTHLEESANNDLDYILSAALDCGVAVSTVIIFFCITLPAGPLNWWGNTVYTNTADGQGTPYKSLPSRGYFGPAKGTWI